MTDGKETADGAHGGLLSGFAELDGILRGDLTRVSALRREGIRVSPARLSLVIVALGMVYGVCMGTFTLFRVKGPHAWQIVASMVKVPLLFYLTLLVTLPSLYVFNALVGSRLTLKMVVRLLVASLGVMVAVLASLGPIVAFFSVSTTSYPFMLLFNVVVCAVSGILGLLFLLQTLQRLSLLDTDLSSGGRSGLARAVGDPAEREIEGPQVADPVAPLDPLEDRVMGQHVKLVFKIWVVVFALVGVQMGWVLRPFIGSPDLRFEWFRGRDSNFFQAVLHTVQSLFS
jgi:hypothetical protein